MIDAPDLSGMPPAEAPYLADSYRSACDSRVTRTPLLVVTNQPQKHSRATEPSASPHSRGDHRFAGAFGAHAATPASPATCAPATSAPATSGYRCGSLTMHRGSQ
jgi:hypothetical protein